MFNSHATNDADLRHALLVQWLEPWHTSETSWLDTKLWPPWLEWVTKNSPDLLPGLWKEWCSAIGGDPDDSLIPWLTSNAPLDGAWRDIAHLCAMSSTDLLRTLVIFGAVSVFSRTDAGVLWVQLQDKWQHTSQGDFASCFYIGWRISRLVRLTPADGTKDYFDTPNKYVAAGLNAFLDGARGNWSTSWEKIWPFWRWRLKPEYLEPLKIDILQKNQNCIYSRDSLAFNRVWDQVLAHKKIEIDA